MQDNVISFARKKSQKKPDEDFNAKEHLLELLDQLRLDVEEGRVVGLASILYYADPEVTGDLVFVPVQVCPGAMIGQLELLKQDMINYIAFEPDE